MIYIPTTEKQFAQTNLSDVSGNIFTTKNISFEDKGKIKLSPRTMMIADSTSLADLVATPGNKVNNIVLADNVLWIGADKNLYKSDLSSAFPKFVKDAVSGTPTLDNAGKNDLIEWNSSLYVCNEADVYKYNGSWSTFSTVNGVILELFLNQNALAVATNSSTVVLLDSSGTTIQTLTLPSEFDITSLAYNNNRLYISFGTNSNYSGIVEWDGNSAEYQNLEKVSCSAVLALAPYKQGCVYLTKEGELYYYSGGSQLLAQLPIRNLTYEWDIATDTHTNNRVGAKGMVSDGDLIYISLSSFTDTGSANPTQPRLLNNFPSGVWCYDPNVGLHLKYTIGQSACTRTDDISTGSVDISTDIITVAGATVPDTGTPCFYKNSDTGNQTNITGLQHGQEYFVIKQSSTTLKLASTYANAIAGTAINLTGTGNNQQFITFHPQYDFGGIYNGGFAVAKIKHGSGIGAVGEWLTEGIFIAGNVQSGTSTDRSLITVSTTQKNQENRGYYTTPLMESEEIDNGFNPLVIKWKKLQNPEDKIIVKYRTRETSLPNYVTNNTVAFTLTSSTTFTTTDDLSLVSVGDEVEIISGAGAGYLAHVVSAVNNSGTWTVTIDETIKNSVNNDRGYAIFQNWKKLSTITVDSPDNNIGHRAIRIDDKSKWLQLKIELRGQEVVVEQLIINNTTHKPVI
jgi:hypothetical protein